MLKIKKIKPMFNNIITTMNKYDVDVYDDTGLIDTSKQEGEMKEYQTVLAVGTLVNGLKVGDVVVVNPKRYAVMKHQKGSIKDGVVTDNPIVSYNFNVIDMDGEQCLLLQDCDIDFIIEEYEMIEDTPTIAEDKKLLV